MLKANKTRAVFYHLNTPIAAFFVNSNTFLITAVWWGDYAQ